jgi:DNA-binding IclR family transcriptional regulator
MESFGVHTGYRVQVLDRTFAILAALGESSGFMGATELGKRLRLSKSTVHRLLCVLEQHRYVERDPGSAKYRLGLKIMELNGFGFPGTELLDSARPYVKQLASETGEAAHLGILRGEEVVSILHAPGECEMQAKSTVGRRSPFHCTSLGKAILAFHPEADELIGSHRFVAYTRKTIRSPIDFRSELHNVRRRGLAIDNEEFQSGLRCIGAPVRNSSGEAVAAISIAGPLSRITADRSRELARCVLAAAKSLSGSFAQVPSHKETGNQMRQ